MSAPTIAEAVIVVSDLEPLTALLTGYGGWRIGAEGFTEEGPERLLAPSAAAPGIRLVRYATTRPPVRSNAMPWDTGGVFDLYMNVADMAAACDAFTAAGWQGYNDPVTYAAKGWRVTEMIVRGPGGVCFCLMQRHEPALPDGTFRHGPLGPIFNMAVSVPAARHAAAVACLRAGLGWAERLSGEMTSPPPGDTPNGQPHDLAVERPRRFTQLGPDGDGGPTLQILSFVGLTGRDLAARRHARALGIRGPRLIVARLDGALAAAVDAGMVLMSAPAPAAPPGLGAGRLAQLGAPEGLVIDLFEPAQPMGAA